MSIFKRDNSPKSTDSQAEMVLHAIHDGVIITDSSGAIVFINPAAVRMTGCGSADHATGLDYGLIIKIESKEGREIPDIENPIAQAIRSGQALERYQACLIDSQSGKRLPVAIAVLPADDKSQCRIITMRDITKELAEEGEQTEFISTASHEMRTPVATIDGYISLALNPQTATIDDRARNYLVAAHAASQHLGKLFRNLLDITRLDDGKIRPHFRPIDMIAFVGSVIEDYSSQIKASKLKLTFGANSHGTGGGLRINQAVYSYVDVNFMREILNNLIDNAIKYTPAGGSIYVNVRGDGDKTLINVTDTGIGISAEDLAHIFQKFYRADNSDTRSIGGTGLGLYLVKQRAEAMGGKVWAESSFGEGSTFYVSLPRLSEDEYNKRMIAEQNLAQAQSLEQPLFSHSPLSPQPPFPPQPAPIPPANPQPTTLPPADHRPTPAPPASPRPVSTHHNNPQPLPFASARPQSAPAPPAGPQPPIPSTRPPVPPQPQRPIVQPRAPTAPPISATQVNNNVKGAQK